MIDTFVTWDKAAFLFLNGFHSGFWDVVMFNISYKFLWIPLYALILVWLVRHHQWDAVWIILAVAILVTISDQLSVHAFKNMFQRLRPCHDPELEGLVHIVKDKCGGQYGFYSSHATNHFALAVFLLLVVRGRIRYFTSFMLLWAAVISYSRVYLGVHFPGDVLAGAAAGSLLGYSAVVVLRILRPGMLAGKRINHRN